MIFRYIEAPLIVRADNVARIRIPVNDLPGQIGIQGRKGVQVFFTESIRQAFGEIEIQFPILHIFLPIGGFHRNSGQQTDALK